MSGVREAAQEDIPRLVEWGAQFHRLAGRKSVFNDADFREALNSLMDGDSGVLLVHDYGMLGGLCYPDYSDRRHLIAQELFWFADADGASLLVAFEDWAKRKGCGEIIMVSLAGVRDKALARVYGANGYAPLERSFSRRI